MRIDTRLYLGFSSPTRETSVTSKTVAIYIPLSVAVCATDNAESRIRPEYFFLAPLLSHISKDLVRLLMPTSSPSTLYALGFSSSTWLTILSTIFASLSINSAELPLPSLKDPHSAFIFAFEQPGLFGDFLVEDAIETFLNLIKIGKNSEELRIFLLEA